MDELESNSLEASHGEHSPDFDSGLASNTVRDGRSGLTKRQAIASVAAFVLSSAALLVVGLMSKWSFGEALGVAGLALAFWGFTLAIFEIHRARTVAVATKEAVQVALRQVDSGRLAITITEMQQLVETIQDSCDDGDRKSFRRFVSRWRLLAGSAVGLTDQRFGEGHPVIPLLRRSIRLGRETHRDIYEEGASLRDAADDFLTAMTAAADELTPLTERLLSTMEATDER